MLLIMKMILNLFLLFVFFQTNNLFAQYYSFDTVNNGDNTIFVNNQATDFKKLEAEFKSKCVGTFTEHNNKYSECSEILTKLIFHKFDLWLRGIDQSLYGLNTIINNHISDQTVSYSGYNHWGSENARMGIYKRLFEILQKKYISYFENYYMPCVFDKKQQNCNITLQQKYFFYRTKIIALTEYMNDMAKKQIELVAKRLREGIPPVWIDDYQPVHMDVIMNSYYAKFYQYPELKYLYIVLRKNYKTSEPEIEEAYKKIESKISDLLTKTSVALKQECRLDLEEEKRSAYNKRACLKHEAVATNPYEFACVSASIADTPKDYCKENE